MSTNQFYSELHYLVAQARDLASTGYRTEAKKEPNFVFPSFSDAKVQKTSRAEDPKTAPAAAVRLESLTTIAELNASIEACKKCPLHAERSKSVPGAGVQRPRVLVVGDFPGFDEDQTGRAFVGEAGVFLDKWLESISLSRYENTYITNLIKCRPREQNLALGVKECATWLDHQIALLKPEAILVLGVSVAQVVFRSHEGLEEFRSKPQIYKGLPTVVTLTPKEVLLKSDLKRPVWEDLKKLKSLLEKRT